MEKPAADAGVVTAPFWEVNCRSDGVLHAAFEYDLAIGDVSTAPAALMGIVAASAAGCATPPIVHTPATAPVTVNARFAKSVATAVIDTSKMWTVRLSL